MQIKDSLGNILTEQQIKYFSDSKVRDSSDNLLVCYHGTDAYFDTFDYEHMNPDSKLGLGFYFTKGDKLQFSYEHELACYVNLIKPLYEYKDADKLAEVLQEEDRLLAEGKTKNEVMSAIVAKFNIDGIIGDDKGHKVIVAFNSAQIKSIENKEPTNRESIYEALNMSRYVYNEPMNGPCFITQEGKFIRVPGDTHLSVLEFDEFKDKYPSRVSMTTFCEDTGYIRVNDGSILSNEIYIMMPTADLNEAQYKALEKYLDYITSNPRGMYISINVLDCDAYNSYPIDAVYGDDVDTDYIMKRIRQCAKSHKLREEFIDTDRTIFATQNVYEAKNLLMRNDKAYRIVYDKKQKLFLIGNTDDVIHMDMIEVAIDSGYFAGMSRWQIPEYMDDAPANNKAVIAIYTPNKLIKETNGADLGEDGYDDLYVYDDFVVTTRDSNWKLCPLSVALGQYKKHLTFGAWTQDKWGNDVHSIIEVDEELTEALLQEKKRQELINKSRKGREYSKKNQARGKNRWERRRYSQVANSIRDYNSIDMNAFFKGDILDFKIKIKGETDDYIVTVTFEHILRNLQQEIKGNNNKLEFKCVLRALLRSFNGEDVYVSCTCPDFQYRFAHNATKNQYNSGAPEVRPNRFDWTNSNDDMGAGCKHINLVLSNTDWMMKIASVINNYIKWTKENMTRNYADIIFPAVYGMPYNKAVQLSLFDDPDDNGYLPSDQEILNKVIDKSLKGRDEKGKWTSDNEYKFKKKDTTMSKIHPEDDPEQLHLDLGLDTKKKQLKLDDEDEGEE